MKTLLEILEICTKSGYFTFELNNKLIHNINFLPLGISLIENIQQEWKKNKGTINTYSANSKKMDKLENQENDLLKYYKQLQFRENFKHIKSNFQNYAPLAIKDETKFDNTSFYDNARMKTELNIALSKGTLLSCSYFFNESVAIEQFYKIQRERKIWWMKFSSNPGRYLLADLKNHSTNNLKSQSIKIKSKYNYGELNLENVDMLPLKIVDPDNQLEFDLMDNRIDKSIIPAVIRTEFCLEIAALAFLFDAIEESQHDKLLLHRKIVPYQCNLFYVTDDEKYLLELEELANYLSKIIRKSGITVFNTQKCITSNNEIFENEITQIDKIGVPFSIILEKSSLHNGLMKLRSRDTNISEIIHISDVPKYLLKIFNV